MKYPTVGPSLLFASGVGAAVWWGGNLSAVLTASGVALALAAGWRSLREIWLAVALVLVGWLYHLERVTPYTSTDLRVLSGTNASVVTLWGEVDETPTLRLVESHGEWMGRTLVPVRVFARGEAGRQEAASGLVLVSTPGVLSPEFFRTQRVKVTGVLSRPPGPLADQLFDYRTYLARQGIWYTLRTEGLEDWKLAPNRRTRIPWSERFLPWAQEVLTRGLPDDETTRLIVAMALGWKTPLTGEVNDIFMQSGTMHVFAISGLHIGLIAWILVELLRLMRLSRAWCGWVAIPLVWFYVGATGWQASAIRSAIMSSVVVAGWAVQRPGQLLNSLAVSAWMILVWDPGQLFQASFQLSFGAVAGLALLGPPLNRWFVAVLQVPRNRFLPPDLAPAWHRWFNFLLRLLAQALAVGTAALMASLPLTVHWFHLMNPVSLLANLVVVPLSSLTLVANFASVLCYAASPRLSEIFNASAWVLMRGMIGSSQAAAALPGGHRWVESPPWLWWLPYYLTLIGVCVGWFESARLRFAARASLGVAALGSLFAYLVHRSETRIAILGGDALVQTGPGGNFLFDGGNERGVVRLTIPYLHAHGVNRLTALWATGESIQQIGGIPEVLREFRPRELWTAAGGLGGTGVRRMMTDAELLGIPVGSAGLGETHRHWQGLHPGPEDHFTRGEDRALVQQTEISGWRVAWLGDLGRPGQRRWLERGIEPVDVVIGEVPPGTEPMGTAQLGALAPRLVILASDLYPASRRVKPSTKERLGKLGIPVIYTADVGSVLLRFRAHGGLEVTGDGWSLTLGLESARASSKIVEDDR